jgi:hypothetical protein
MTAPQLRAVISFGLHARHLAVSDPLDHVVLFNVVQSISTNEPCCQFLAFTGPKDPRPATSEFDLILRLSTRGPVALVEG